jgi:hypothetical protein
MPAEFPRIIEPEAHFPRIPALGRAVNNVRGRSYEAGVASHGPGAIRPGLCGFLARSNLFNYKVVVAALSLFPATGYSRDMSDPPGKREEGEIPYVRRE